MTTITTLPPTRLSESAAHLPAPRGSAMIRCIRFRRHEKNTLQGFADLELVRTGIIIHDCCWHRHENGSEWVSFPARLYTDKTGATQWQRIIDFAANAHEEREAFRKQALDAIHAAAKLTGTANSEDAT